MSTDDDCTDGGPDNADPTSDGERPLFPPPSAPLDVARRLYSGHRASGLRTMLAWRRSWMRWDRTHWAEMDAAALRSRLYDNLGEVDYLRPIKEKGVVADHERTPWNPDKRKVANVLEAMEAVAHLSTDVDPPSWIGIHNADGNPAAQVISCENGLLDLSTRTVTDHTPALFNVVSVPFNFDESAPKPVAWLEFLESVWPDDPESIALLQEFMGYVLSGCTDMQKMLLLIGPTRSGKGTIASMLVELVGHGHSAGPTLASLGTNFGLSSLLGKPLAVISDARLGDTPAHTVVERLLSITGEDRLDVDRKFRDPWSGKLPTRFVILTNELPKFRDASAAIANRMLILQMTESFRHKEDRALGHKLRAELPGILLWALKGLDRLNHNGRFTVPQSSEDAANLMADLTSPVSAFVRDCCDRGVGCHVWVDDLYRAWKDWAEDNGHQAGAKSTFGRNLRAVVPEIKITNPRVNGVPVRRYEGIAIRCNTHNAPPPSSPQSLQVTADFRAGGIPHQSYHQDSAASADEGHHLHQEPAPTCSDGGDEGTGPLHTQQKDDRPRCGCGAELFAQASIDRSLCAKCHLASKQLTHERTPA